MYIMAEACILNNLLFESHELATTQQDQQEWDSPSSVFCYLRALISSHQSQRRIHMTTSSSAQDPVHSSSSQTKKHKINLQKHRRRTSRLQPCPRKLHRSPPRSRRPIHPRDLRRIPPATNMGLFRQALCRRKKKYDEQASYVEDEGREVLGWCWG